MNKATYELIDKVDDELSMLGMVQKMLTYRAMLQPIIKIKSP